jgi:ribosomal-protein-serine acetyltransferase
MTTFRIGDDILLREFREGDAPAIFACVKANREHLGEYMAWMKPNYSMVDAREFVAQSIVDTRAKVSLNFGIFCGDRFIGTIGFSSFDKPAGATEIGYWIDRGEQGKGIVSRACEMLIDHAFNELKLNRIQICCAAENVRSSAIPERFGFRKEGCLRQSVFRNGKLHDFLVFGLLASQWKQIEN